ncbi:UNVERIFIED_CONTAM: hypothetical protein Sangu_0551400 [Sesamum angustifolium]|uniref:Uncharacterized protein n=1 Tax=Sesamum angustifolium TaxID=2727405 RepID=A0AAW2QAR3_9LAMI
MSYADLISLKHTIQLLLNSSHQIPILPPYPEIIQLAYQKVESLEHLLNNVAAVAARNSEGMKAVDKEIGEAAFRLEDVLESAHVSLSQSQILSGDEMGYLAMEVKKEIDFLTKSMEKIKEQVSYRLRKPEEFEEAIPSRTDHFIAT